MHNPNPQTPKFIKIILIPIESLSSMDPSSLHSVYCDEQDHGHLIDLGLSLRTLQPNQPPPHLMGLEPYGDVLNWGVAEASSDVFVKSELKCRVMIQSSSSNGPEYGEEDAEVVQSKQQRWRYVKVNMDGVIVGRKVCIFEHGCYSSLALQLQDMFGRQCESGLKLFEIESEFSLFYKDGDENWRSVGDVPWKKFVEGVKRLKIGRKDEAFVVIDQN